MSGDLMSSWQAHYRCIYFRYMAKTLISIKVDKEVKEKAQEIARELGFSLSAIVNAYLKQFIRTREVYFSLLERRRIKTLKIKKK